MRHSRGRTQYERDRDGKWRGKRELAERRIGGWSTGCMYPVQLIRVALGDVDHEGAEHALRADARVSPDREWFDLRRVA
jgi:hypothetical protein